MASCGALKWYQMLRSFLLKNMKMIASKIDESLYVLKRRTKVHGIMCVVADDLCMVGDEFAMKEFQGLQDEANGARTLELSVDGTLSEPRQMVFILINRKRLPLWMRLALKSTVKMMNLQMPRL